MSLEDIDWYPLPEVNIHSSVPNSVDCNISICTVDSSVISPQGSVTATQLDDLWKKFLDMCITKPFPLNTGSTCICHRDMQSETTPIKIPKKQDGLCKAQEVVKETRNVTLQQACQSLKKDFIRNSIKRQEAIKQRSRKQLDVTTPIDRKPQRKVTKRAPPIISSQARPKMTYKAMYEQSKKYWNTLPEVIAKEKEKSKQKVAATNRLRVKIYQRKVLTRMRRIRNKR